MTAKSSTVYCFVPGCSNTRIRNPQKLFFNVPKGSERIKWTNAIRRDPVSEKSTCWCCEDHFTLEEDVADYVRYKILKEAELPTFPLRLKRNVLPHIFNCQLELERCQVKPPCSAVQRRQKRLVLQEVFLDNSADTQGPSIPASSEEPLVPRSISTHNSTEVDAFPDEEGLHETEAAIPLDPCIASSTILEGSNISYNDENVQSAGESALSEPHIDSSTNLEGSNISSNDKNVQSEGGSVLSEPRTDSSSILEGTFEAAISRSIVREEPEIRTMVDSFTSPIKSVKDFTCQVRPRFRSRHIQAVRPVMDRGVMTSPIKNFNGLGIEGSSTNGDDVNASISTAADFNNDSSYCPNDSEVTDASFADSELHAFQRKEHVKGMLSLVESNPKSFLGIDPHHMFVISGLETYGGLSRENIFMCLWKIRKNEKEDCLGLFFNKSKSQVSKIFAHDIPIIADLLETYIFWPDSNIIQSNVPLAFRANFSKVESIIDCFEVQIEKPSDPSHQANTWSDYKQCNTMKFLISCTPGGLINFISEAYGGRTSDMKIVMDCGYLDKLKENTQVMADRGFKQIETELNRRKCTLIRPPSVESGKKMSADEVRLTKQIASLRIHVERVIRRIREFEFLGPHICFNHHLLAFLNQAATIACALSNLQSPIVH